MGLSKSPRILLVLSVIVLGRLSLSSCDSFFLILTPSLFLSLNSVKYRCQAGDKGKVKWKVTGKVEEVRNLVEKVEVMEKVESVKKVEKVKGKNHEFD